jgi:hypothetical protein
MQRPPSCKCTTPLEFVWSLNLSPGVWTTSSSFSRGFPPTKNAAMRSPTDPCAGEGMSEQPCTTKQVRTESESWEVQSTSGIQVGQSIWYMPGEVGMWQKPYPPAKHKVNGTILT